MQALLRRFFKSTNFFELNSFWKFRSSKNYSSVCAGLCSLPFLGLLIVLFILKVIQMASNGIVITSSQINYSLDPPLATLTTNQKDNQYAPFMLAFTVNSDNVACPNNPIAFEAYVNQYIGRFNTANRTISKVPLNFETCTSDHFAMLQGSLKKLSQWTTDTLYCLPKNSYFQIGGANSISDLYKNIQYRFACPSSCSGSSCGYVEFFSASSTVNLQNASSPYSYTLSRNRFQVLTAPKYQISYQIDSSNMTTDNSLLPYSANSQSEGVSLGSIITDISRSIDDKINYVTIQRSDKTTIFMRSYYKIFDLLAYMGGIIYGLFVLLYFLQGFSAIQFQLSFAAQYFRVSNSKYISFRGFLKQMFYELIRNTRWRPDWRVAEEYEKSREAVNRILDVVYLNKRISFLEEAISLIFQKHQLKGIQLLQSLKKQEVKSKSGIYHFRDRLVYFLGKKYKHKKTYKNLKYSQSEHNPSSKKQLELQHLAKPQVISDQLHSGLDGHSVRIFQEQDHSKSQIKGSNNQIMRQQKQHNVIERPIKLTLKALVEHERSKQHQRSLIINEAENYYSQLESEKGHKGTIVNSSEDHHSLLAELKFIGELSPEQLDELELIKQLQTDMKRLIDQGESQQPSEMTKKIYKNLDEWLKNYLKDMVSGKNE